MTTDTRTEEETVKVRKSRQRIPEGENREQRFSRLATIRTRRAIGAIRAIRNLSQTPYKFTPEQVEKIDEAIATEEERMRQAFQARLQPSGRRSTADDEFSV